MLYSVWFGKGEKRSPEHPEKVGFPTSFFSVVETLVQIRVSLRSTDYILR